MLKKIFTAKSLHAISIVAILGILLVASIAHIENDTAYIKILNMPNQEIGKCFWRSNFGVECPSCGLTRSFISIEDLNVKKSFYYNRIGIFAYFVFILLLIYNALGVLGSRFTSKVGVIAAVYAACVVILLFGSWILKVFIGI